MKKNLLTECNKQFIACKKENKLKEEIKVSSFTKFTKFFTKPLTENKYEDYETASWYKRFASFFLDTVVVVPIYLLFIFIIDKLEMKDLNEAFIQSSFSLFFFIYLIYFWIVFKGQTIGQFIMKTKIVSDKNEDLSIIQNLARLMGYIASNIVLGIVFLTIFITKDKKCLHDMTSKAKVVDLNKIRVNF